MRFALLDRDGTIIVEKHYLRSIDQLELLPDAVEGLRMLAAEGFGLIIITNQSGIARGLVTLEHVEAIHVELRRRLADQGVADRRHLLLSPLARGELRLPQAANSARSPGGRGIRIRSGGIGRDRRQSIRHRIRTGARGSNDSGPHRLWARV